MNIIPLKHNGKNSSREVIEDALSLGCLKAKIIPTKNLNLGTWIRLKCQFGCPHFGKLFTCPPYTPGAEETSDILADYSDALLIDGGEHMDLSTTGITLEKKLQGKGFHKAFLLTSRPCDLCETCTLETSCRYPEKARPTIQACGIDIHQMLSASGWEQDENFKLCAETLNIGLILLH